jgi:hypothetical protein
MKKKHLKVIQRIQNSIPQDLKDHLMKTEPYAPTTLLLIDKILADGKGSPELREKLQAVKDSGELNRTVEVVNRKVEKEIDSFIESELKKAIKRGELPEKMEKLKSKSRKNGYNDKKGIEGSGGKAERPEQDNGGVPSVVG